MKKLKETPKQNFLTKNNDMRKVHEKPTSKTSFAIIESKCTQNWNNAASVLFGPVIDEWISFYKELDSLTNYCSKW